MTSDVLILGAGPAGLSAAARVEAASASTTSSCSSASATRAASRAIAAILGFGWREFGRC